MTPNDVLATLLALWPRLPALAGPDWPRLYWQLVDLLRAYAAAGDEDARAAVIIDVMRLLANVPAIKVAWSEATAEAAQVPIRDMPRDGSFLLSSAAKLIHAVDEEVAALLSSATVTRYTDIGALGRVQVGRRFPITVGLTVKPSPDSARVTEVQLAPGQVVRVVITATDLEVIGERVKEIVVEAERDSEPALFFLRAADPGLHPLVLDFWANGQIVATYQHSVVAVEAEVEEGTRQPAELAVLLAGSTLPRPDLILRVTTVENRLRFDLAFADGSFQHVEGALLRADPQRYRLLLMAELEALAPGKGETPDATARQLARIGQRLYRDLFPPALRREYRRFRNAVRTLLVVSDEPWIPWELVKPYDDDDLDAIIDDEFLCLQFDLTRWLAPARPPADEIAIRSLACIAPADSKLPAAQAESAYLRGLAAQRHISDLTPDPPTVLAVLEGLLEGDAPIHLWHFACHGRFDDEAPGQTALLLQGKQRLRSDDIVGKAQTRLKTDRPLVFLNACRVGAGGLALTGLGGWAKVMAQDCGVGALVAPMWDVDDVLARRFAGMFYEAVQRLPGCTVAQAVAEARRFVRQSRPHDPAWLAYSVYGHPNARVVLW
jgi:hypothetical protein